MEPDQEERAQPSVLDVDSELTDSDSGLGESLIGSYSESLSSSVLNYQYENGRRYHAYRQGVYVMPNDESEQIRLDMQHHIFRMIAGGELYYAPLSECRQLNRVLDLGTGTGNWAIDLADEFPNSIVIGNDLSPIQPTWVPPNCSFYVEDIESPWTYAPHERFDFIHGRTLSGSIGDFKKLFRQAYENLNPGGWLEMQEYQGSVNSDDDTLKLVGDYTHWNELLRIAFERFGKSIDITAKMKRMFEEAGFVNVEERIAKVPVGPWAKDKMYKELGIYFQAQMLDVIEPASLALFTRVLSYSQDEAKILMANARNDVQKRGPHIWVPIHFIWGKKPD